MRSEHAFERVGCCFSSAKSFLHCILQVAKDNAASFCQHLGYSKANMHFIKGHIEYLDKAGIPDDSINIVISNCVINLSPDKQRVLQETYRVLAPGGEFYFSDVYCDRRLPQSVRDHKVCCVLVGTSTVVPVVGCADGSQRPSHPLSLPGCTLNVQGG